MNANAGVLVTVTAVVLALAICRAAPAQTPAMADRYSKEDRIMISLDGKIVGDLPCERIRLTYPQGVVCPFPRMQFVMATTRDGHVWAAVYSDLFESSDGGRSWSYVARIKPEMPRIMAFGILRDDSMIAMLHRKTKESGDYDEDMLVVKSTDRGKTWNDVANIPRYPWGYIGVDTVGITQLSNGTLLAPLARANDRTWTAWVHEVWHSGDGGATWGNVPFLSGNESSIIELKSGKLLAAIRRGRYERYPWDPPGMAMFSQENSDHAAAGAVGCDPPPKAYKLMTEDELKRNPGHAYKGICIAESDNKGVSWHSLRPVVDKDDVNVMAYNEVHGQLGQLPDGRVVLVHCHRAVPGDPVGHETIVRVSHDEGKTWDREAYHAGPPGESFPAGLVLDDGTILVATTGPCVTRFQLPPAKQ